MFDFQNTKALPLRVGLSLCLMFCMMIPTSAWAQNVRAQSGIVAATSGLVRVVSNDIGRIAETGQKIYLDDVVETGDGGKMQIMLMDRTTMTIGPNTSLVIDQFVFDPGVERTLSAKVLKGTFKLASPSLFNTGKESREIKLPNAVVAIRGTEIIGSIAEDVQNVVLLDGAITVANDNFVQDIDRPNFGVSISEAGEITPPQFFSSEELGSLLEQLDGAAEPATPQENANTDTEVEEGDAEEGDAAASPTEDETSEPAAQVGGQGAETDEGTAPSFITAGQDGPEPTEAEVTAAAEAIADGSADIEDLQVLSRAGPQNIAAISRVLGVNVDDDTGQFRPNASPEESAEAEANFVANVQSLLSRNGLIAPEGEGFSPDAPELSFNLDEGGLAQVEAFSSFLNSERFDEGALGDLEQPNFTPTFFDRGTVEGIELDAPNFDGGLTISAFNAPDIEFNPVAFESLNEFTVFEPDGDFFFEAPELSLTGFSFNPFFEPTETSPEDEGAVPELSYLEPSFEAFEEEASINLDHLVTEALEEVINEIAQDTSSVLPDHTYMPTSSSYRSWNGSEWSTIAQNFNSGTVRFEHNDVTASFHSGSYCSGCSAQVSNTLTINFNAMEYQFQGSGTFSKPGYGDANFEATTPDIPLNYWELSSGTISQLPNERELESIYDNAEVYTLTSTSDPSDTVTATIDLDFKYDTLLSDNNDLNSNIGVYGLMEVEYTETGSSEVTFRTEEEAMTPVAE